MPHIPYLPYDASSLHGHLSTIIHDHSRVLRALLQLLSRERLKEGLCRVLQDWKAAAKWGNDYFNICVSMHPYMCIRRTKNLFLTTHTHNKHVTAVFKLKLPRAHSGTLQLANRKFNGEKLCGGLGHQNCECWSGSMIFSGAGLFLTYGFCVPLLCNYLEQLGFAATRGSYSLTWWVPFTAHSRHHCTMQMSRMDCRVLTVLICTDAWCSLLGGFPRARAEEATSPPQVSAPLWRIEASLPYRYSTLPILLTIKKHAACHGSDSHCCGSVG